MIVPAKATGKAGAARRLGVLAAMALVLGLLPALASAATPDPAPHWKITSTATPSHFTPGDSSGNHAYLVTIVNTGGEATDGSPIVITDVLPTGVTVNPNPENTMPFVSWQENNTVTPCDAGPPVTCTITSKTVYPGENITAFIPVDIAPGASGTLENQVSVSGGGPSDATAAEQTPASSDPAGFGFQSMDTSVNEVDGEAATQAGSHPYRFQLGFQLNTIAGGPPAGRPKDVIAKLPPGLVLNPAATPVRCTEAQLETKIKINGTLTTSCPDAAAVGLIRPTIKIIFAGNVSLTTPIYNMVPPPGVAAAFAFEPAKLGIFVHLLGGVDSAGDYALRGTTNDIPQYGGISGATVEFWGDPSDPSHERRRGFCGLSESLFSNRTCPVPATDTPLITMPSACTETLSASLAIAPWENRGSFLTESAPTVDSNGNPVGVDGCNALEFEPTITSQPTTNLADSPTGLDVVIHQPQNDDPDGLATAALKDVTVTLPAGMTLNPSAGNGLSACSEEQIGYAPKDGEIHFSEDPQSCPDAAKVGTLEVSTPLLEDKLGGSIYVAKPYENPFGSLLAIYLAIEDKKTGIVAKLAGKVTPDPQTGQLTARFTDNPQLPIEDIETHFFNGPRAPLKTPLTCGTKTTTTVLTPWSTPEGADATPSDSFQTAVAPNGGPCPSSEAQAPNKPAFTAGTVAPQAGAYSPFLLKLTRPDGSQRLTGIDATMPKGLTGKLAGIPYCSEAQIAQAKGREAPNQGAVEQAGPSCPLASEVGSVTVGAGAGITPLYVGGHAYLAGPYKSAPISLVVIVPAVAGPFDLGAVVSRTALYVNSETAQIHAVSDPLPSIIQGIPLDLRSIALKMDRPNFTLNPTSCDPTAITGAALALTGQSAALTSPFQVGGCSALKFKPKLAISLKGGTKRSKNPALRAVVTYPKGGRYANIASAQVTLPHSAFLEQAHIGTVCTRVQFAADSCPKASIYGFARAFTPLLDKPVEGPVYLRSSSHELPDLVAALEGQVNVDLVGRVDTGKGGGIRNTFEATPDAPVSKFVLEMKGGKKGLLVNSENICKKPQRALVSYRAHNGDAYQATPLIKNDCGKKKHKAKKHRKAQR